MENNSTGPKDPKEIIRELERAVFNHPGGDEGFLEDVEKDPRNEALLSKLDIIVKALALEEGQDHDSDSFFKGLLIGIFLANRTLNEKLANLMPEIVDFIFKQASDRELDTLTRENGPIKVSDHLISESSKALLASYSGGVELIPTIHRMAKSDNRKGQNMLIGVSFVILVMNQASDLGDSLKALEEY